MTAPAGEWVCVVCGAPGRGRPALVLGDFVEAQPVHADRCLSWFMRMRRVVAGESESVGRRRWFARYRL